MLGRRRGRAAGLTAAGVLSRSVVVAVGVVVGVAGGAGPALAHDSIEQALARGAGPPAWIYTAGVWAALGVLLAFGAWALVRRLRPGGKPPPRWWAATGLGLAGWLLVGFAQAAVARTGQTPTALPLVGLGQVVFLLALTAVWAFVVANTGGTLRRVLADRRYLWVAVAVGVVFAGLYLWAGNIIAPPEPDDMPPPGAGAFVAAAPVYGPLATWPAVQFWLPQLTLFGAPSVGTVAVTGTIAALLGLTWSSALFAARAQRRASRAANTRLGGVGGLGVAGASFCCCCTPALYPVLALTLGTTTAFSVSAWLLGTTSPFYNLSMIVMIGLMLGMLLAVSRRIHRLQHMDVITATPATGTGAGATPEAVR